MTLSEWSSQVFSIQHETAKMENMKMRTFQGRRALVMENGQEASEAEVACEEPASSIPYKCLQLSELRGP